MFDFFDYGFLPGVFHFLFMATLPLAIFLWVSDAKVLAGIVFVFGAPLFRNLRNNSL
tara:strand:+ start:2359 stop:2529 length:171 start_codon:yes stop_codon:yes gene_type:complete